MVSNTVRRIILERRCVVTDQMKQVVETFVDITNSQSGLSLDDATLRALLICCDAARLAQGVIIERMENRDEYVVTATRADLARMYDDSGPMLDSAWTVLEDGRSTSHPIDFTSLPTSEVAMTLRLIGAKSIHQFPIRRKSEVVGVLVLFGRSGNEMAEDASTYVQGVADATMAVVETERRLTQALELVGQLSKALESRVLIEQAKGIIAERYSMSQHDAFSWLRSLARNERGRLHDVAQRIVASTSAPFEPSGVKLNGHMADTTDRTGIKEVL
jgi:hypothetical protein